MARPDLLSSISLADRSVQLVIPVEPSTSPRSKFADALVAEAAETAIDRGSFVDRVELRAVYRFAMSDSDDATFERIQWAGRSPSISAITSSCVSALRTSGLLTKSCAVVRADVAALAVDSATLWTGAVVMLQYPGDPGTAL